MAVPFCYRMTRGWGIITVLGLFLSIVKPVISCNEDGIYEGLQSTSLS